MAQEPSEAKSNLAFRELASCRGYLSKHDTEIASH
jgi:hypothetical protein